MNDFSLADVHCDTAYELYKRKESFYKNSLAISAQKVNNFKRYLQVMAIWSEKTLSDDEAYAQFFEISDYLKKDILNDPNTNIYQGVEIKDKNNFIISVEDARILNNDISRLKAIYDKGVRIITLLWTGDTCIGGSFDTDNGLTPFGKSVVKECSELGIIPDISHTSVKSAYDVFEICENISTVIASHSDSYDIHPHRRNLRDEQFKLIRQYGGIVGLNLCREHLGLSSENTDETAVIIRHIEHYLSLGGENTLCLGCDFDGADTPASFPNVSSLHRLADAMARINYTDELIEKIFYSNAEIFILNNIK